MNTETIKQLCWLSLTVKPDGMQNNATRVMKTALLLKPVEIKSRL
jgi:hypothetical protein